MRSYRLTELNRIIELKRLRIRSWRFWLFASSICSYSPSSWFHLWTRMTQTAKWLAAEFRRLFFFTFLCRVAVRIVWPFVRCCFPRLLAVETVLVPLSFRLVRLRVTVIANPHVYLQRCAGCYIHGLSCIELLSSASYRRWFFWSEDVTLCYMTMTYSRTR